MLDYEVGFKLIVGALLSWFWMDKKETRDKIKDLERRVNTHSTEVAVLEERINSVKEDTTKILEKLN